MEPHAGKLATDDPVRGFRASCSGCSRVGEVGRSEVGVGEDEVLCPVSDRSVEGDDAVVVAPSGRAGATYPVPSSGQKPGAAFVIRRSKFVTIRI